MVKLCLHCGNKTKMDNVAHHKWTDSDYEEGFHEEYKYSLFMCPVCNEVTFEKESLFSEDICFIEHLHPHEQEKLIEENTRVEILYPFRTDYTNHVNKDVQSAFESAIKVRNIDGAICVLSLRRTLEIMCKDKGETEGNLYQMLKSLSSKGILPPILDNMASILRKLGNAAAHANEIEFDREKVDLLVHFTKTILDYVYTLPAQLEELQTKFDGSSI